MKPQEVDLDGKFRMVKIGDTVRFRANKHEYDINSDYDAIKTWADHSNLPVDTEMEVIGIYETYKRVPGVRMSLNGVHIANVHVGANELGRYLVIVNPEKMMMSKSPVSKMSRGDI